MQGENRSHLSPVPLHPAPVTSLSVEATMSPWGLLSSSRCKPMMSLAHGRAWASNHSLFDPSRGFEEVAVMGLKGPGFQ